MDKRRSAALQCGFIALAFLFIFCFIAYKGGIKFALFTYDVLIGGPFAVGVIIFGIIEIWKRWNNRG